MSVMAVVLKCTCGAQLRRCTHRDEYECQDSDCERTFSHDDLLRGNYTAALVAEQKPEQPMGYLRKLQDAIDQHLATHARHLGIALQEDRCNGSMFVVRAQGTGTQRVFKVRTMYRPVLAYPRDVVQTAQEMLSEIYKRCGRGRMWTCGPGHVHVVADDGRIAFLDGKVMLRMFYVHEWDDERGESDRWPWGDDVDVMLLTDAELGRVMRLMEGASSIGLGQACRHELEDVYGLRSGWEREIVTSAGSIWVPCDVAGVPSHPHDQYAGAARRGIRLRVVGTSAADAGNFKIGMKLEASADGVNYQPVEGTITLSSHNKPPSRDLNAELIAASVQLNADPYARLMDVETFIAEMNRRCEPISKYVMMERDLLQQRVASEPPKLILGVDFGRESSVGVVDVWRIGPNGEREHVSTQVAETPPTVETPWMRVDGPPPDPLDVEYDGWSLRKLLKLEDAARRENVTAQCARSCFTPAQRAAVSAHWSAELRKRTEASAAAERSRVVLDLEDD